jgi:hypothetical protein
MSAIDRLVGGRLDERDVLVGERLRRAHQDDDADQVVLDHDRDAEQGSVGARPGVGVFGVELEVRHVNGPAFHGRAAGDSRPVDRIRMLSVVLGHRLVAVVNSGAEHAVLEQPERTVVGVAEPSAGLDDLLEHRLEPGRDGRRREERCSGRAAARGRLRADGRARLHRGPGRTWCAA